MEQSKGLQVTTQEKALAELNRLNESEGMKSFRLACQGFTAKVNTMPEAQALTTTPDGKAKSVLISHIEMTMDEYFFGLWHTENFRWERIQNEIVGSIDLIVMHPVSGQPIKRTGAAAITIMVDAVPEEFKGECPANITGQDRTDWYAQQKKAKNMWALNAENKKSNALDMGFPKLKSECVKNAANSIGKLFGRDLNRKLTDEFKPLVKAEVIPLPDEFKAVIELTETTEALLDLWNGNKQYQSNPEFLKLMNDRRVELDNSKTEE